MNTAPLQIQIIPQHASVEEYSKFVLSYYGPRSGTFYISAMKNFVNRFPLFSKWFELPLIQRVGRIFRNDAKIIIDPVCYRARSYLYFLVSRNLLRLDWDWLIGTHTIKAWGVLNAGGISLPVDQMVKEAVRYGYDLASTNQALNKVLTRIILHSGKRTITEISDTDCQEFREAVFAFRDQKDICLLYRSKERFGDLVKAYTTSLTCLHVVLFHRNQATTEPRKLMPVVKKTRTLPEKMEMVLDKFLKTRLLTDMPETPPRIVSRVRAFSHWLINRIPEITSFGSVSREHILEYADALKSMKSERTNQYFATLTIRGHLSSLGAFFRDIASWGWENVPTRPLLGIGDLPKMPTRVPRFIPEDELFRLMLAIESLDCPFQRTALLIARWSGARKEEIRRLEIDCLDRYQDGTPRLRVPAGKTKKERMIPLNQHAADAILQLQAIPRPPRGFRDSHTGKVTHYLFLHHGRRLSSFYLFTTSLRLACNAAGLLAPNGKPTVTPHRFRHTVGTQLAEKGATLHTIMKILGHTSASMSMVYAQISDPEVLRDYQSVLGPGAVIAGPCAENLRSGQMTQTSINWLKSNFFKTELELGHCLRLPQEGPCECDLYLNCAKFVTTPDYAPRLRRRRKQEFELVQDARERGWAREAERHQCVVNRIDKLLIDLGLSIEGTEA